MIRLVAFEIRRTNHVGAKNGGGAWCRRADAKTESSRVRRRTDDPRAVAEGISDMSPVAPCPPASPSISLSPALLFQER